MFAPILDNHWKSHDEIKIRRKNKSSIWDQQGVLHCRQRVVEIKCVYKKLRPPSVDL